HHLDPADPARCPRATGAGRPRPSGRGAAPGVRDPRDRTRPALGVLDPPRLDPRAAGVSAVLALRDVRRVHPSGFVLDVSALDVAAGELLAIMGPNGSGKSTLLS